ncbi:MAG: hypothetical protein K2X38_21395 [Gemmataceae bacterium]|nr:hypothetical protein [Gemmataceae bacterium]
MLVAPDAKQLVKDVDSVRELWRRHSDVLGPPPQFKDPTRQSETEDIFDSLLSELPLREKAYKEAMRFPAPFHPDLVPEPALGRERFVFTERGPFFHFADCIPDGATNGLMVRTDHLGHVTWFRDDAGNNRWRLRVVPLGKTLEHLRAWLQFAINDIHLSQEGKLSHGFSAWDLAEHTHILADEIEGVEWPPRPSTATRTEQIISHLSHMLALAKKAMKANANPVHTSRADLIDLDEEIGKAKRFIESVHKDIPRIVKKHSSPFGRGEAGDELLKSVESNLVFLSQRFAAFGDVEPVPALTDIRSRQEADAWLNRAAKWLAAETAATSKVQRNIRRSRLAIDGDRILLDGEPVLMDAVTETRTEALTFLTALVESYPNWITGSEIGEKYPAIKGIRLDRLAQDLPPEVKSLIKSCRRKGRRLVE